MKLIFLGPPGAGKGTVAKKIEQDFRIVQISTGDLLREAAKNQTVLGKEAKSYMDKGMLVPDNLIIELMKERVAQVDCKNGFILDGYPRTIPQADALEGSIAVDAVINFSIPGKEVVKRLSGRRNCPKCGAIYHVAFIPPKKDNVCDKDGTKLVQRADDKEEAILKRLDVYKSQTEPLIDYYAQKKKLITVDASKDPQFVYESVKNALRKIRK